MTAPSTQPDPAFKVLLLEQMDVHFNLEEFKDLCFRLGVLYDNVGGENLVGRKRELILDMERRGRLPDLVAFCTHLRPHLSWPSPDKPAVLETPPPLLGRVQRNPHQIFISHASQDGAFAHPPFSGRFATEWLAGLAGSR